MTERAIAKEIVDAAFRMQTPLGPGLLESIDQTVLAYQLGRRGLHTVSQQPSTASRTITPNHQTAKRHGNTSSASPWNVKGHAWLSLARGSGEGRRELLTALGAETQRTRRENHGDTAEPAQVSE